MNRDVPTPKNSPSKRKSRRYVCVVQIILLCTVLGFWYGFPAVWSGHGFPTAGSISADGARCQINNNTEASLSSDLVRVTHHIPEEEHVTNPVAIFDVEVELENKQGNVRLVELFVSEPFWNSTKQNVFVYDFQKPDVESKYSFKRIVGVRQTRRNPHSESFSDFLYDLIYPVPTVSYVGNRFGGSRLGERGDMTECWFYYRTRVGMRDAAGNLIGDWKKCLAERHI